MLAKKWLDLPGKQLLSHLNGSKGSLRHAVQARSEIQQLKKQWKAAATTTTTNLDDLHKLDSLLVDWLSASLNADNLTLEVVDYQKSSAALVEYVVAKDTVLAASSPNISLSDIKQRFSPRQRIFAFTHASFPNEPLAFIQTIATPFLAATMKDIESSRSSTATPTCAMFYSINAPFAGLKGIDLGGKLIKAAASALVTEFPSIHTLSTLSPVPGLAKWLQNIASNPTKVQQLLNDMPPVLLQQLHELKPILVPVSLSSLSSTKDEDIFIQLIRVLTLSPPTWLTDPSLASQSRAVVLWLGSRYIAQEKLDQTTSLPLDEVARFHMRNGASFQRLNWLANTSPPSLSTSLGLCANYVYQGGDAKEALTRLDDTVTIGKEIAAQLLHK